MNGSSTSAVPRFFVDVPLADQASIVLPAEVARHVQVLRLEPGDALTLFDGSGGQYRAELVEIGKRTAVARTLAFEARELETPYRITLAQGIAGGDKMDWLIEKAVELGVAGVAPLSTSRGVVRLSGERADKRVAHWQGVVRAACEQCGRNRVPAVAAVSEYAAWLAALPSPVEGEVRLMLSPRASIAFAELPKQAPTGEIRLLIGPEGGLSPAEEDAARECGFQGHRAGRARAAHRNGRNGDAGGAGRALGRLVGGEAELKAARPGLSWLARRTAAKSGQSPRICVGMPSVSRIGFDTVSSSVPGSVARQPSRSLPLSWSVPLTGSSIGAAGIIPASLVAIAARASTAACSDLTTWRGITTRSRSITGTRFATSQT